METMESEGRIIYGNDTEKLGTKSIKHFKPDATDGEIAAALTIVGGLQKKPILEYRRVDVRQITV